MNLQSARRAPRGAYHYEKRALRVRDTHTTVSMERFYWTALDAIAKRHKLHWRSLVRAVLGWKPRDYKSRSGWLRYYVTGYWILGPLEDLPLLNVFMPDHGWSLRQLHDHFAAERSSKGTITRSSASRSKYR